MSSWWKSLNLVVDVACAPLLRGVAVSRQTFFTALSKVVLEDFVALGAVVTEVVALVDQGRSPRSLYFDIVEDAGNAIAVSVARLQVGSSLGRGR